jgi:hypothetical protein
MRSPEQCIKEEIQRLSIVIASERYDYTMAIIQGKPLQYRRLLADSIESQMFTRECLELGNFKHLPYNVKLLYDK